MAGALPVQAGAEHKQQRPVDGRALRDRQTRAGRPAGLECSTTYYFRVSARGDGSPYSTTFGSASSSVSRATSACAPTIGVDVQSPFVGQAVTMTVSTTGSSGTVSSYQWQEWSAGSWTDLGCDDHLSHKERVVQRRGVPVFQG